MMRKSEKSRRWLSTSYMAVDIVVAIFSFSARDVCTKLPMNAPPLGSMPLSVNTPWIRSASSCESLQKNALIDDGVNSYSSSMRTLGSDA